MKYQYSPEEENCTRNEVETPPEVSVFPVKEPDGRLKGHLIVIGSLEVVATMAPFLRAFGLTPEGVQTLIALMTMTSPVMVPVMVFVDVVGSVSLMKLEDMFGWHRHQDPKPPAGR